MPQRKNTIAVARGTQALYLPSNKSSDICCWQIIEEKKNSVILQKVSLIQSSLMIVSEKREVSEKPRCFPNDNNMCNMEIAGYPPAICTRRMNMFDNLMGDLPPPSNIEDALLVTGQV